MGSYGIGELEGELVYTGYINNEGKHWQEADETERVEGFEWIANTIRELCK
jgi:hypothetical protein